MVGSLVSKSYSRSKLKKNTDITNSGMIGNFLDMSEIECVDEGAPAINYNYMLGSDD